MAYGGWLVEVFELSRFDQAREAIYELSLTHVTDRPGDPEHVLHELSHAATLRIGPDVELTHAVSKAVRRMMSMSGGARRADMNEIMTTAVEIRAGLLACVETLDDSQIPTIFILERDQ